MVDKRFKNPAEWTADDYLKHTADELSEALDEWREDNWTREREQAKKEVLDALIRPKEGA